MGQMENMALFVRIVESGGIGKAAAQLDIAKSAVSRRLVELEKQLDTQLLSRTTRQSHLTDAGRIYYQKALTILNDVAELNAQTSGITTNIEGTLKLTAPLSFGLTHLAPIIDEFSQLHTNLCIDIDFSDRHVDLVEEGYELAIRISNLKDSTLKAKRLTSIRHFLCASPDYLKQHGQPINIEQLSQHRLLQYTQNDHHKLHITDPRQKQHQLDVNAQIKANNGDFLKMSAINGQGIVALPLFIIHQAITEGQLVPILTDHQLPILHAYAVYPQTRFLSQRCRLLIDFISDKFSQKPLWDSLQ
ncbi:LysR family transcriptional regulator [Psychromonas sp. L1A2]|uniref:LysR family transcriptional regulator n=1 Tax=Psychromonas sp. L1A2 TaxID=2686356 RepID=UPI00135791C5|nr:LysR family transcriptional regulator [Psychromonas sp. L1A2]